MDENTFQALGADTSVVTDVRHRKFLRETLYRCGYRSSGGTVEENFSRTDESELPAMYTLYQVDFFGWKYVCCCKYTMLCNALRRGL